MRQQTKTREKTIAALKRARKLLEKGWVQGHFAVTRHNVSTSSLSPDARAFCAIGAIHRGTSIACRSHTSLLFHEAWDAAVNTLRDTLGSENLGSWNDDHLRTKEEVLALYDKAIARLEKQHAL